MAGKLSIPKTMQRQAKAMRRLRASMKAEGVQFLDGLDAVGELIADIYKSMPIVYVVDTCRMAASMTRRDISGHQWHKGDRFIELATGVVGVPKSQDVMTKKSYRAKHKKGKYEFRPIGQNINRHVKPGTRGLVPELNPRDCVVISVDPVKRKMKGK